jgi:hypothetical protein
LWTPSRWKIGNAQTSNSCTKVVAELSLIVGPSWACSAIGHVETWACIPISEPSFSSLKWSSEWSCCWK